MHRRRILWILAVAITIAAPVAASSGEGMVDHRAWDRLVHRYVVGYGVNYKGLQDERAILDRYIKSLAEIDITQLSSRNEQLALWINAYNACTLQRVLQHYPLESVKSVKGFFDRLTCQVGDESLTLNQIEANGRALGDWRIHFALVCASSSCPPLRPEAYTAERLDEQLSEQTLRFLSDTERGLRIEGDALRVSRIFKWYTKDFLPAIELGLFGNLTAGQLLAVIEPYMAPDTAHLIRSRKLKLKFLDYNWSLNEAVIKDVKTQHDSNPPATHPFSPGSRPTGTQ